MAYGAGMYIPFGNSTLLVDSLKQYADNLESVEKMSNNAYKLFLDKYVFEKSYLKYKSLLRR